eukprot:COSAG01_NODE_4254_length_5205_cov_3.427145_4_plen_430_part_00
MLVLDRATDLAAPLLHELTYQAMCHDLLDVTASGVVRRVVRTVVVARSAAQSRGEGGSRSTAVHGLGRAAACSLLLAPCSLLLAPSSTAPPTEEAERADDSADDGVLSTAAAMWQVTDQAGQPVEKQELLSDTDPLWRDYKYWHISELVGGKKAQPQLRQKLGHAIGRSGYGGGGGGGGARRGAADDGGEVPSLPARFEQFKEESKIAQLQQAKRSGDAKVMETKEMMRVVKELPQFRQKQARFNTHIELVNTLLEEYKHRCVVAVMIAPAAAPATLQHQLCSSRAVSWLASSRRTLMMQCKGGAGGGGGGGGPAGGGGGGPGTRGGGRGGGVKPGESSAGEGRGGGGGGGVVQWGGGGGAVISATCASERCCHLLSPHRWRRAHSARSSLEELCRLEMNSLFVSGISPPPRASGATPPRPAPPLTVDR